MCTAAASPVLAAACMPAPRALHAAPGFKCFEEVDVGPCTSFTGIIGPNGCGKSVLVSGWRPCWMGSRPGRRGRAGRVRPCRLPGSGLQGWSSNGAANVGSPWQKQDSALPGVVGVVAA